MVILTRRSKVESESLIKFMEMTCLYESNDFVESSGDEEDYRKLIKTLL